jgi:hypothetical protein
MWDKLMWILVIFLALVSLIFVYNFFVNLPFIKIDRIPTYAPVPVPDKTFPTFFKKTPGN